MIVRVSGGEGLGLPAFRLNEEIVFLGGELNQFNRSREGGSLLTKGCDEANIVALVESLINFIKGLMVNRPAVLYVL